MKVPSPFRFAVFSAASLLAGCQSSQVGKKADALDRPVDQPSIEKMADAYRRSGAAPSMLEAQRMAENYYWPESAHIQEEQQRREVAARAAKP